nr:his-tagged neocarzinostatin apoprotein mutant F76W [synthetic construct]
MRGSHHHHHHGMASMTGGQQMGRDLYDDDDKDRWGSAAPTATVTPSSGLSDGTVVKVAGAGLQAGTAYDVGQCAWVDTGVLACNPADFSSVTADANGSASTSLTVRRSFEGWLFDGTRWGTVDCTTAACQVGLSDAAGNGPEGVAISFN